MTNKKSFKKKGVCIVCHKEKMGYPVETDYMIEGIARLKKLMKTYKGNKLVVCEDCFDEYKKKRDKFVRNLMLYGGIGAVLGILLILTNLSVQSFLFAIFLELLMLVLAHMSYVPKVVNDAEK